VITYPNHTKRYWASAIVALDGINKFNSGASANKKNEENQTVKQEEENPNKTNESSSTKLWFERWVRQPWIRLNLSVLPWEIAGFAEITESGR